MRNRGLVFAMESEEALAAMAGADDVVTTELVDDIETPAEESSALVEDIETAHDDLDTLEQVQDVMAESVESGEGLSPEAAEMAEIVTESIMRRMGIKNHRVMPALESFGSKGSRLSATELAMEGITDTMKRIWRAIKKAFKQVWQYIKDTYKRYFDGITKLEALVKKAEEAYKNIPSSKPENDKLDLPTVFATFSIDGEFKEENVATILKNHVAVTNGAKVFPDKVKKIVTEVESTVKTLNNHAGANTLQTSIKTFVEGISPFLTVSNSISEEVQNYFGPASEFTVRTSKPLASDRVIAFGYNSALGAEENNATDKDALRIEMTYFNANTKEKGSDDTDVKTLERSAMMSVITASRDLLKSTKTYNEESKKVKDIDKRADNIFDTIERSGDKAYDKKGNDDAANKTANNVMKASAEAIRAVIKTSNTLIVGLPKENLRAVRIGLDYVFASMAEYRS